MPSATAICARTIAHNLRALARQKLGNHSFPQRPANRDIAAAVAHAEKRERRYLEEVAHFHGRAAEVGPGPSPAIGLFLTAMGCERVDLVDRFYFDHDEAAVSETKRRYPSADPSKIRRFHGPEAMAETFFDTHCGYDLIISSTVMEHVADPVRALKSMARALNPGGFMLHGVDLRDHGLFTRFGYHELKFLGVPKSVYRLMSCWNGHPSRTPLRLYREAVPGCVIKIRRLAGVGVVEPAPWPDLPRDQRQRALEEVRRYKPGFAPSLRGEPDKDLAVTGFSLAYTA